jgi:hypothetical protein
MFRYRPRCSKYAATDRVTDDDSEPEAQAEDTKKTTASFVIWMSDKL